MDGGLYWFPCRYSGAHSIWANSPLRRPSVTICGLTVSACAVLWVYMQGTCPKRSKASAKGRLFRNIQTPRECPGELESPPVWRKVSNFDLDHDWLKVDRFVFVCCLLLMYCCFPPWMICIKQLPIFLLRHYTPEFGHFIANFMTEMPDASWKESRIGGRMTGQWEDSICFLEWKKHKNS